MALLTGLSGIAYANGPGPAQITLAGTYWETAANEQGLDPLLLYSVALAESLVNRGGRTVSPWPYVYRTSEGPVYGQTREEVERWVASELAAGRRNIDIGLLQISLHWHGHRISNPIDLVNPETNMRVAAQILAEAMSSAPGDPVLGVGRYHSWREDAARRYGERVIRIYQGLTGGTEFTAH